MQFLTSLFGGSENVWLTAAFALGVVIVLIVLVSWILRLFAGGAARQGRGRNRRLAVVDSLVVDPKRTLLIVRRDDVEHLILTGGPSDVVIEAAIPLREADAAAVRSAPARPRTRFTSNPAVAPTAADAAHPTEAVGTPLRPGRRHPGLLRPVSRSAPGTVERIEHANSGHAAHDSDMNEPHDGPIDTSTEPGMPRAQGRE